MLNAVECSKLNEITHANNVHANLFEISKKNQLIMLTAAAIRSLTKSALLIYETGPVMTSLAIFNQLDCGSNTHTQNHSLPISAHLVC